jgi:hypothetical protein
MAVTTNRAMTAAGDDPVPRPSTLAFWSDQQLENFMISWQALTKIERRARRLQPPSYVRTSKGILNINTAEHVILPDPPMTDAEIKELRQRERDRIKKTVLRR